MDITVFQLIVLGYIFLAFQLVNSEDLSDQKFKLSDLPVLKKWEIPNHHFSRHVGRKYRDLERERKRSAYWELKPEFTANELDWDEDPEKLKLDFNYKSFLEEDEDTPDIEEAALAHKRKIGNPSISKIHEVTGDKRNLGKAHPKNLKISSINRQVSHTGSIKTKKNPVARKSVKKRSPLIAPHSRSRRSLVEEHDGEEEDELMLPRSFFVDNIVNGDESDDEIRDKRAAIWDAVRRIEMSQGQNGEQKMKRQIVPPGIAYKQQTFPNIKRAQLQRRQGIQYPTPFISHKFERAFRVGPEITKKSKIPIINQQINRRQRIPEINNSENSQKPLLEGKKKYRAGELGDEQMKRGRIRKIVTRQNIGRPKEHQEINVDSSNVARAVTMAMEQLKRDKMWGKVFVHVRPSGQLKVMVQETKKMDDNE